MADTILHHLEEDLAKLRTAYTQGQWGRFGDVVFEMSRRIDQLAENKLSSDQLAALGAIETEIGKIEVVKPKAQAAAA
jgi:hypothetical protein